MSAQVQSVRRFDPARLTSPRSIGILGIVLGALAFWLALPPLVSRTVFLPVLVGILAVACGIWAIAREVSPTPR